jgi:hypothetical protein
MIINKEKTDQTHYQVQNRAIEDRSNVLHKNVRTMDRESVDNVVGGDERHRTITAQGGKKEYLVPKLKVKFYNGSKIILAGPSSLLSIYMNSKTKRYSVCYCTLFIRG